MSIHSARSLARVSARTHYYYYCYRAREAGERDRSKKMQHTSAHAIFKLPISWYEVGSTHFVQTSNLKQISVNI